jgi:hypothetical protein
MQIPPNESFWRAIGVEIQILGPDSLPPTIPCANIQDKWNANDANTTPIER